MGPRHVKVISVDDKNDGRRIKVRFKPEDNRLTDDKLPYAFPFLPKIFNIIPKVGESVLAFTMENDEGFTQRFYVGPVISQDNHMYYEPYELDSQTMFIGTRISPEAAESVKPDTKGVYPKKEDIALEGRKNTDIILTEDDVRIRAGVKLCNEENKREVNFNDRNSAFIKVKFNPDEQYADNDKYHSTAAVVADKVLLLGNVPKDGEIITADREDLISDEKMKELIEKSHELPYGDKLVEFLMMFRDAFINHVHPFPTKKPCATDDIKNLQKFDLTTLISNSIRIN